MSFQLRTYAFIDRMQPQAAAHVASTCQGDVPIAGMAELFIEVAPGNEIFRCADIALKAADVRPALQIVEREFGLLEIHSHTQAEVQAAGQAVLDYLGLKAEDRLRPKIASSQFVTNVNPYQAQLINKWRKGNLLLPRSSLFVLEASPAAYVDSRGERGGEGRQHQPHRSQGGRALRAPVRLRHGKRGPGRGKGRHRLAGGIWRPRMSVITARDVEGAKGVLIVGLRDVITPLADRPGEGTRRPDRAGGESRPAAACAEDLRRSAAGGERRPRPEPSRTRRPRRRWRSPARSIGAARPCLPGLLPDSASASRPADSRPSAAVVGAGHVGAMTALRLAETSLFSRVVLTDIVPGLAAGLALDMWHSASLRGFTTRVEGSADLSALAGADYIVVTAGRPRQPGMSRTDLTGVNAAVIAAVAKAFVNMRRTRSWSS